ncbi:twin-arginine translocation signal domain-containing protein [Mesorhizobium soli]
MTTRRGFLKRGLLVSGGAFAAGVLFPAYRPRHVQQPPW